MQQSVFGDATPSPRFREAYATRASHLHGLCWFVAAALCLGTASAATKLVVTVVNPGALPRPAETIAVPWSEVSRAIPGVLLQHLTVKDPGGLSLAYQVTNVNPEVKDPENLGLAYGDLIFQHDFAAGEKAAVFTVESRGPVAPVFPSKVFARFVPERYDDFAWENDVIAHRTYGPALAAPDTGHTGKEVTVSSGIDVWSKRVSYLIVNRWYNKGRYHLDEGEGLDMYGVHASRGCGGTGIWVGGKLAVSGNFKTWRVLANGPIRAIFELSYDAWTVQGRQVTETKRYTVDAGHNLDQVESMFAVVAGAGPELTVGIGLSKDSADPGQDPHISVTSVKEDGSLSLWVVEKTHGSLGTAVIVPGASFVGFAEDDLNHLVLARAFSGKPLRFYAGAGWSEAGRFTSKQSWNDYVAAWAVRLRNPVSVSFSTRR